MTKTVKSGAAAAPVRRAIGRPQQGEPAVGREALIQKTCELMRTVPPGQITRADLARHANVDPGLIRYYFRDMQTLLVAAAESLCARFGERMAQSALEGGTPDQRIRARIGALLDLEIEQPYFNRLMVETVITSPAPEAKKLVKDLSQRGVQAYREILEEGVAGGTFRAVDSAYLYFTVIGLCEFFVPGLPVLASATGGKPDIKRYKDDYRDFICNLVLDGLRPQGKALPRA